MAWRDIEFTGIDSVERVRRLQAFCADPGASDGSTGDIDGILIIGGVDSFHSRLSQALLKYLFLGSSGQELLGEQVISQQHDRLEEVVLMLTRRRVSIFYSSESEAAVKILPVISQWRNVTEYVIHDGMDPDDQENRKIHAFKQMVSGTKRIGIPYGLDENGKDLQDNMIPEKWPLVQSFGLEDGANGRGFFTMNHFVVNISRLVQQELSKLDDFCARRIVQQVEPLLSHHYNQFLAKLDHAETPKARCSKSESEMAEDLLSFYEFGTTQYEARGLQEAPHRGCRVLFGKRTASITTKTSSNVFLRDAGGVSGRPATHFLVQTEDPFSGVRFIRTYFLATGKLARQVVDEDALVHPDSDHLGKAAHDKDEGTTDTSFLIELYVLLLRGFRVAVDALAQECHEREVDSLQACLNTIKREAIKAMCEYSRSASRVIEENALPMDFLDEHLVIHAEPLDGCGQEARFPAQRWNLLFLSLEIQNVMSRLGSASSLGSVIVGDTVLFQSLSSCSSKTKSVVFNTTASFPYLRSWIQSGLEAERASALLTVLQSNFMLQCSALQLGRPLAPLDASLDDDTSIDPTNAATSIAPSTATGPITSLGLSKAALLVECLDLPILNGSMQLFSSGFCFRSQQVNPLVISFARHVSCFRILSTPFEELVLLQLDLKLDHATQQTPLAEVMPFKTQSRCIAFPLLAGTRFQEEIVRALATWKDAAEDLSIPFYRPHEAAMYDGMTPRDGETRAAEVAPIMVRTCEDLVRRQSQQNAATTKIAEVFFPRWFIPKESNPITTLPRPKQDRSKMCVPITITLGIPGSNAQAIGAMICSLSGADNDWHHVVVDCREADIKDAARSTDSNEQWLYSHVQTELNRTLARIVNERSENHPRVMLSVTGYVDPITVAAAIKAGSVSWAMPSKISAVISCVSALNAYLPDSLEAQNPLPKLFDQFTSGFVTHIILTHVSNVSSSYLGRLRYHMDQVNPFADIQVLPKDVFEGQMTSFLATDRFDSTYYKAYRDLHYPHWALKENRLNYVAGFDSMLIPESVRFEIAPGTEKSRFIQLLGAPLTPFAVMTKSIDKIHPMDRPLDRQSCKAGKGVQTADNSKEEIETEYGICWCIDATVTFSSEPETVYQYISTGTYAHMRVVSKSTSNNAKVTAEVPLEVKITGQKLNASKLNKLILGCYAKMDGAVQPMRTKKAFTMEEKREIQKKHMMDPLPDGFFFDGITYIDTFGGRHEFHPQINEFIEEHVRSLNEEAEKNNAKVEENRKSQVTFVKLIA
ncbi:hypothetical protein Poli38472_000762 [Pythium oligandrum]|uniref:Uncharacterized protein n=1 Tax=Pythium oligandrum TaxID=41045 RepID=A0A8K1FEN0_PYTOL|nr:hypothetical protein Poli38472_000762 [Pythium oligandrum]|eukprot:TMW60720.1 hypothetical protein Poli38472_000762 [Pythium oligandrum]